MNENTPKTTLTIYRYKLNPDTDYGKLWGNGKWSEWYIEKPKYVGEFLEKGVVIWQTYEVEVPE